MGVDYEFVDPSSVDLKKEITALKESSLKNRKIIYFELFGVAYADTDLDEKELGLLDEVSAALEIGPEVRASLENIIKSIFDAYKDLGNVLNA